MISYLASFLAMVLFISVFVKELFSSFYFFPLKVFRLQSCHSQPDLSKAKLLELLNFFTLTHFLQLSKSIFMTFYFTFFCFLMSFSKFGPLNCWQHTNSPPTSAAYMSRDCNSSFSYKTVQGACTEVFICYRCKSCLGGTPFLLYGWHTHSSFQPYYVVLEYIQTHFVWVSPSLLVIASHQSLSEVKI